MGLILHAGNAQYLPSSVIDTVEIGKYSSSTTLTINTETPTAIELVTFTVVVDSATAGKLANVNVMLTYGDGNTNTSITNANGEATGGFTHIYALAGNDCVIATFARKATLGPFLQHIFQYMPRIDNVPLLHSKCIDKRHVAVLVGEGISIYAGRYNCKNGQS